MKFILLILLLPVSALCQEIPKKANTLKVTGVNFKTAASQLIDQNYMIDQKDEELGTIYTKPCSYGDSYNIIIYVRIKDSVATITSKMNTNMDYVISGITFDMRNYETVANKGSTNKAFAMMNKYAKSFGKPVEYLVVK